MTTSTHQHHAQDVTHVEYDARMHAFLNFWGVLSAGDHAIRLIAAMLGLES